MDVQLIKTVIFGGLLRLGLHFAFPHFIETYLANSVHFTTPLTSFKKLTEGLFLQRSSLSPYAGDMYHQSPLLLAFFGILEYLPKGTTLLMYTLADCAIALLIAGIAKWKYNSNTTKTVKGEPQFIISPTTVAMLYLFNPLNISTTLSKSTIVFSHLATMLGIYFATKDKVIMSLAWITVATHISLYPALLSIPISLWFSRNDSSNIISKLKNLGIFVAMFLVSHTIFLAIYGKEYFSETFGFILLVTDLQPNVGLYWYFFIEVFDEFRSFYLTVFHLVTFVFAVPISWTYRHDFVFSSIMILGLTSILKSYPSWGDFSIYISLLPIYEELFKYFKNMFTAFNLLLYGIVLSPVFWNLWIQKGSGNANFSYAATLVFAFGQIILLFDLGSAMILRKIDVEYPEMRTKEIIQE